jgi:hypothetical protein
VLNILARNTFKKSRKNFKNQATFVATVIELLDSKKKTAKSLIIKVLSEEWPLSARKIYNALRKDFHAGFTYQAVYFALREFAREGVVISKERKYSLSPKWVESISSFADYMSQKYSKEGNVSKKQLEELSFSNISEVFRFALANINSDFFGKSRILYAQVRRLLPFPVPKEDEARLKSFCKANEAVILCAGNGLQDKLAASFLRKLGAKVYLGVCCAQPTGTVVINDSVVGYYVLYPARQLEKPKDIMQTVNDRAYSTWLAFLNKKLKVKLVINRDPAVREAVLWATKKLIP